MSFTIILLLTIYRLVTGKSGLSNENVLLLVHGYPSSSRMFRMIIPILAKYFRVIAIDLPTFGFSSVPSADDFDYTFLKLFGPDF